MGEHLYMLPSDMTLKIRLGTIGYNNKIFVSDGNFSLGKNENVNLTTLAIKNHKTNSLETPTIKSTHNSKRTSDLEQKTIISHEDEKVALVLSLTGIYDMVHFSMKVSHQFNKKVSSRRPFCMGHLLRYINHMSVSLIINHL